MTTPSRWDEQRRRKGRADQRGAGVPKCSRCGSTSVLDPCRKCASPKELARYPKEPEQ